MIEKTKDICAEGEGFLCQYGKCVNTDDGGYICECNEGFVNVAVEGGYRCQGKCFLNCLSKHYVLDNAYYIRVFIQSFMQ